MEVLDLQKKLLVAADEVVAVVQLVTNEEAYLSGISRSIRTKVQLPSIPVRTLTLTTLFLW